MQTAKNRPCGKNSILQPLLICLSVMLLWRNFNIESWLILLRNIILFRKSQLVTSYTLKLDVNRCFWNPAWSKGKHVYKPVVSFIKKRICQYTFFSVLGTFNSFVNARYSDISVDCNDFDAGFLITYRKI
jgi:hypothetical protein